MNEKEEKQAEGASQKYAEKRKGIIEHFPKKGIGAEIGVLYGHFSKHILEIAKPKMLCLVDPWEHDPREEVKESNCGRRSQEQMNEMYKRVLEDFKKYLFKPAVVYKDKSIDFYNIVIALGIKFDFVYIDGDHTFLYVMLDLVNSWNNLSPGGVIAGDDYGVKGWWGNGVTEAADAFCDQFNLKSTIIGNQFLIRKA